MTILIVGGSRGIGKETARLALQAGHQVTVFARHPESIGLEHANLRLVRGDVLDLLAVLRATTGQAAVICTLGLPTRLAIGPPFAKRSFVLSAGTANILAAMRTSGVKRLLVVTAIGAGDSARHCTPLARLAFHYGLRWLFTEKDRQEKLVRTSKLAWTIVRPTTLTNGQAKGALTTNKAPHAGLWTQVSRTDVAQALLASISNTSTYRKVLYVTYRPRLGDSLRWLAGYFGGNKLGS